MSYIALYRALRPKTFSEVVGQKHISKTLQNALINNRVAHAYLFCGPRGTGKTSSAKLMAKAVNCLNFIEGEPCNKCTNCQSIDAGNCLDVLEIDAASNRGIDEIREIRDKIKFAPSQGKIKVYIIDEVHMLTTEAFNALLKTLEEPPEHVLFILATTEPRKIPLTILSRCQRFDFRKISDLEIKTHLAKIVKQEGIEISNSALNIIARRAAGGMRDAISVLDQCIAFAGNKIENEHVENVLGTLGEEQIIEISCNIINKEAAQVISQINDCIQRGKDVKQIVRDLIEHFRQLMLLKLSQKNEMFEINKEILNQLEAQAAHLTMENLANIILKLTEVERELRWNSQPQILLEATLVELIVLDNREKIILSAAPEKESVGEPVKIEIVKQDDVIISNNNDTKVEKLLENKELKNKWPEILEKIKQKKITVHAFLLEATVGEIEGNTINLIFKQTHKFHRDKILQRESKTLIEEIIEEFVGAKIKINCLLEGGIDNKEKIEDSKDLVEQAIELFGGNIVEIKD